MDSSIRHCLCKVLLVGFQITNIFEAIPKMDSNLLYHFQLKAFFYFNKKLRILALYSRIPRMKRICWGVQTSVKLGEGPQQRNSLKREKNPKIKYCKYILDIIQYWLKTAGRSALWAPFPFDLRWNKFIQFNYATESLLSQSTLFIAQIPKPLTDLWSSINPWLQFLSIH